MYLWTLVGHNTSEGQVLSGFGDDLPKIMREGEELLCTRRGFLVRIVEVVQRMSVFHLDEIHVPTGREWTGRRDRHGGVLWQERYRPADPDVAYTLAARHDLSALAG